MPTSGPTDAAAWLLSHELAVRLGAFLGVLALMAAWELLAPRRALAVSKARRWAGNLGIVVLNSVLVRLVFPMAAVGFAALAQSRGWGLFNAYAVPQAAAIVLSVVALDLVIYLQHVMFHALPALWRLHRMHHADLDFDVTTGARFHPIEILLSMLVKFAAIALLGAPAAFAVARYLAAGWVARRAGGRARQLVEGVEQEGWRFVAFVRLVPLFPFNLLNYALGLTRIRLAHYVLASYVFMLPGALAYTYLGYAGREALAGGSGLAEKALVALALLAAAAFLPRFVRRLRSAVPAGEALGAAQLEARLAGGEEIHVLDVRTAADYAGGHVPGAVNVPLEVLPRRLAELQAWRGRPLAVICRSNRRSGEAVRQLKEQGFSRVLLVHDGMLAWERGGFPVESRATRESTKESVT